MSQQWNCELGWTLPTVESRFRRTISDKEEAERSRCWALRSAGWQSSSMWCSVCIRGQRVWSQFVLEPSAIGVDEELEWRGRISTTEKPAEQLHSSPIWAGDEDVLGCRPALSCRSPVETKLVMTWAIGEQALTLTDRCSVVDAAAQIRPTQ